MKAKNNLFFGLLLWGLFFVEVSILGSIDILGAFGEKGITFTTTGLIIHYLFTIIFMFTISKLYYKGKQSKIIDRFYAIIGISIVGLALDAIITVPLFIKDYAYFFGSWTLWLGVSIGIIAFSLIPTKK